MSSTAFRHAPLVAAVGRFFCTVGCSGSESGETDGHESPIDEMPIDEPEMPIDEMPGEWTTLISGDWTLPGTTEGYTCARKTIEEDLFIVGFEAINPIGTHHTLLTMGDPDAPDGVSECNAGTNRPLSVFGSGVGTDPLALPPGVALKVEAGTQILLNLHLFNTTLEDLSGTSGTRIRTVQEPEVEHFAEGLLAGTVALQIPPGETTKHTGYCTMSSDVTLFAVSPHMHQIGIHEKIVAESARDGETVLLDQPYSFDEQSYKLIDPIQLAAGDRVRVECTHRNESDSMVGFGESSLSEMCFAGLYRYPADGSVFICVDEFGNLGNGSTLPFGN